MGCICSKGIEAEENVKGLKKGPSKSQRLVTSSKKEDAAALNHVEADAALIHVEAVAARSNGVVLTRPAVNSQENVVPTVLLQSGEGENNAMVMPVGQQRNATVDVTLNEKNHQSKNSSAESDAGSVSGIFGMPNGFSGEHLAAGWPVWLTSIAPEAVNGWLPRRGDSFEKLNKIGQGTYSNVYKARDLQTGKIVALKKVRFVNMDPESVRFMAREIHILRRLDHPNVVKLEGIVTSRMSCNLYLVFEYMDHDLTGLAATAGIKFTELQVKCYMQQLLCGLEHCHSRGVLHRDIKGANLLMDNNGILRIADFGLATFFNPEQKQTLTSRVVTLWYRPPELLLGATEYGVAVDLWSCGCIFAELLAGKPIMPGRTEVEQLHKIFKLCGSPPEEYWRKSKLPHTTIFKPAHPYPRRIAEIFRDSPLSTLALLDTLLAIQPEDRGSATSALQSEFFATKICDPSSLPKYPPSKEYDVKLRDEEVMRKRAAANKDKSSECRRKSPADHKAMQGQNANEVLQRWQDQSNQKSRSEKYSPQEGGSGFPIDPPRTAQRDSAFGSSWTKKDDMRMVTMCASSTNRVPNGQRLRSQNTYTPQGSGMDFAITRSSISSQHSGCYVSESTEKQRAFSRASSIQKRDAMAGAQEPTTGYVGKGKRFQYSGPLMHPGGNMEELLKEHERQIQHAVRKARLDKVKTKKHF